MIFDLYLCKYSQIYFFLRLIDKRFYWSLFNVFWSAKISFLFIYPFNYNNFWIFVLIQLNIASFFMI